MIGHWNLGGLYLYGHLSWVLDVARTIYAERPERPFVRVWR